MHVTYNAIVPGAYTGIAKYGLKKRSFTSRDLKINHSPPIYRYISEMVEDRWVYAARRLTSIEFSFDPCNIYRDCPSGVPRGGQCALDSLDVAKCFHPQTGEGNFIPA